MEVDNGMKELVAIAEAYYNNATNDLKVLANNFFKALDKDGNDQVSLPEFMEYMRVEGYAPMRNREFFNKLDRDKNGRLDFMEIMSLYYILKSGRPFCAACSDFITGMFFACTKCFDSDTDHPYCVCLTCYAKRDYVHEHKLFMDNYAILELKRKSTTAEEKAKAQRLEEKAKAQKRVKEFEDARISMPQTSTINSTTRIVPYRPNNKVNWKVHLVTFTANVAANMCNIM